MVTKYGSFSSTQLNSIKHSIRKSIYFLLLYVDPQTSHEYPDIDVREAFRSLQYKLDGLNSILLEPPEIVKTMSLLESALNELQNECFDWNKYRKLVLDAGAEIMRMKVGDSNGDFI